MTLEESALHDGSRLTRSTGFKDGRRRSSAMRTVLPLKGLLSCLWKGCLLLRGCLGSWLKGGHPLDPFPDLCLDLSDLCIQEGAGLRLRAPLSDVFLPTPPSPL